MPNSRGPRSFWTYGFERDLPTDADRAAAAQQLSKRYGVALTAPPLPQLSDIELRKSRISIPTALQEFVSQDKHERASHTYGAHGMESLLGLRGQFSNPPDAVAHPRNDDELTRTLSWCDSAGLRAVPWGGGTSVVWGLTPHTDEGPTVVVHIDLMDKVLEVDPASRAARIQAGAVGPDLEEQLKPHGFTLRFFPQSFPWSSLGGWIATRAGGHYATNQTHIDDLVESVRMLTPTGWWESRRLPGSGAGPSPDRLVLGSEGQFGVITEAWMRVQARPRFRATAGVVFPSWEAGWKAVRDIAQTKLWPANLRLLDPGEAGRAAGLSGNEALLIIGFESAELPQGNYIRTAVEIARGDQGRIAESDIVIDDGKGSATGRDGAVGAWRDSFIGVNAGLTAGLGLIGDTFETAITWDRWPEFDAHVRAKVGDVLKRVLGPAATLTCRFTHVYTDGPAPYYSFGGVGKVGGEREQWQAIKSAAMDAVIEAGGTVTHHHAVGRMHKPGYSKQRPNLYDGVLRAIKKQVDPRGILNPGVLFD